MGFKTCDWSAGAVSAILNALQIHLPTMSAQQCANTIHGLGVMGFEWCSFPDVLRLLLEAAVGQHASHSTDQGVANTVYGLGRMGVKWAELNPQLTEIVVQKCLSIIDNKVTSQHLANIMFGFGLMEAPWSSFSAAFREASYKAINSVFRHRKLARGVDYGMQSIVMIRLSFHHCGQKWDELPVDVTATLNAAAVFYKSEWTTRS
jgi:hypothetical protein